jgi:cytochrome c553
MRQGRGSRSRQYRVLLSVAVGVAAIIALAPPVLSQGQPPAISSQPQTEPSQRPEEALAKSALENIRIPDLGNADIKHGQQIVLGTAARSPAHSYFPCFQCHEVQGQGKAAANFPRLTGQTYRYLYYSLRNFASGARVNPVMQPIAQALTDDDMRDVSAYYAALSIEKPASAEVAKSRPAVEVLIQGATLAAIGSAKDGVQGCSNCHGPAGAGLPPVYPYLAGQFAIYLESQLKAFKDGQRRGDPLSIMPEIAKRLSDEQIHAVATYYASLQPPLAIPQKSFAGPLLIGAPLGPAGKSPVTSTGQGQSQ